MKKSLSSRLSSAPARGRVAPLIMALFILVLGAFAAYMRYYRVNDVYQAQFHQEGMLNVNGLAQRVNDYQDVLYVGQALLQTGDTSQSEWQRFFTTQPLASRFAGMSSISYVRDIQDADKQAFVDSMRQRPDSSNYTISPAGQRNQYAVVQFYASSNNISRLIGFDFLSDPARKSVFDKAAQTHSLAASGPMVLQTGYRGFFVVLPRYLDGKLDGYLVAGFRLDTFMKVVLSKNLTDLQYSITDVSDKTPRLVYRSAGWNSEHKTMFSNDIAVGDRMWHVDVIPDQPRPLERTALGTSVGILLFAFCLSLWVVVWSRRQARS